MSNKVRACEVEYAGCCEMGAEEAERVDEIRNGNGMGPEVEDWEWRKRGRG